MEGLNSAQKNIPAAIGDQNDASQAKDEMEQTAGAEDTMVFEQKDVAFNQTADARIVMTPQQNKEQRAMRKMDAANSADRQADGPREGKMQGFAQPQDSRVKKVVPEDGPPSEEEKSYDANSFQEEARGRPQSSQNSTKNSKTNASDKEYEVRSQHGQPGNKIELSDLKSVGLPSANDDGISNPLNRKLSSQGSSLGSNAPIVNLDHDSERVLDDDNMLLDEQRSKFDIDAIMYQASFFQTFLTVMNYIYSDILKRTRSFKIGVFTIFMVVSFIMMLKALVDIAPIAFLKVG